MEKMKKTLQAICMAVMMMVMGNVFGQANEEQGLKPVNKYGYEDASGKLVIPLQYYGASEFSEGLAAVNTENSWPGKWGYINEKGAMVIAPQYEYAGPFSSGLAHVRVDDKYGFIDKTGKMVIQPQFDNAGSFSGNVASVRIGDYSNGKWGVIDKTGKMVIQPQYDDALNFENGVVAMTEVDGKEVLINNKGKTVIEFPADADVYLQGDFENGWDCIRVDDKSGLADENGWVMEPQFFGVDVFGAMAWVEKDGKAGVLKKNGQWFIEPKENLGRKIESNEGILCVRDEDKYGYINGNGWLVKPQYTDAEAFAEGLAAVKIDDKWGFIDKTGKICIEPQFYRVSWWVIDFIDGLALVKDDNEKCGFIDKKGNWAIRPQYDDAHLFQEDFAGVEIDGKWGYINKAGKTVINPQYEDANAFSQGLAAVKIGDKWGYIDTTGKMVIQPKYDSANEFLYDGMARVRIGDWENGIGGYVDRNGNFTPDEE